MVTTTAPTSSISFSSILKRGDIAFALGLMSVLVLMIVPISSFLLDITLAISIAFSVLILMTSLFIERPLEFSVFPTILLVSTMIRLSLNIASTRLILSKGHEGSHAAGKVIQAFGHFVMGGNFVIGMIVFAILLIVNFVVITKGSGRIAEVSARFSLDAMPGKQMAIDADLSAGMIDEAEAKKRRKMLEEESNFFGAMDGAAKFVRGDAIAGLLITFINIIGGIIIGVAQMGITLAQAAKSYTILTVGDGLVSQIPALIVSTAAGMLVSKAGVEGAADKALFRQLGAYPAALGLSSFLMVVLAMLPGIPMIPFLLLALVTGGISWKITKAKQDEVTQALEEAATKSVPEEATEPPLSQTLQVDHIRIELGYGLLGILNTERGKKLTDQIKNLRKQLAQEIGFVLPSVRIQDNLQLSSNEYLIRIKELEAGRGQLRPNMLLVIDPQGKPIQMEGEPTREPTFGLEAMWVPELLKEEAERLGYTVVDTTTVLTTHMTEIVKDHLSDLLTYADTQKLLDDLSEPYKKLLNDMIPAQITLGGIQRILQNLVSERVSIRDLPTILEAISEACSFSRNVAIITEHVRLRLSRQITFGNADENGILSIVTLTPYWEQEFSNALLGENDVKQLALAPSKLQEFISKLKEVFDRVTMTGESAVLITSAAIRPYVRSIIERVRPATIVMGQTEVHPKARIKTVGQL